jgi:hypothetical protein
MPIQRSAGAEIRQLIDALGGSDDTRREGAIARLAVIGPRAVEHLLQEFPGATGRARAGMLRALEALADPRSLPTARGALTDGSATVQSAAVGALRALLGSGRAATERDAFDALVAVALDRGRIAAVRLAAWDALGAVTEEAREPVRCALAADADPEIRAGTASAGELPAPSRSAVWQDAAEGRLPASPAPLKAALAAHRSTARLTELQRLVDRIRTHEQQEADPVAREEWRAVRGAVHQALAARNSRLALYDLCDSLLTAERLPVTFLAAMEEIGDATCLDTLAAAYEHSSRSGDTWWRQHLASAFRAIVQRDGLTRRHAAIKRVLARWPDAAAELIGR